MPHVVVQKIKVAAPEALRHLTILVLWWNPPASTTRFFIVILVIIVGRILAILTKFVFFFFDVLHLHIGAERQLANVS